MPPWRTATSPRSRSTCRRCRRSARILLSEDPYRGSPAFKEAARVGEHAFAQNCARCHGLGAVSGGIAPDLRKLTPVDDDEYFIGRVMSGQVRNGVTYMPPFGEILSQEAIWAIRSWLDTVAIPQ